jgi:hypothetical protein
MTILAQDIKLRASRVMADVPEGGGGPSAALVQFGRSNQVFDDIDSISRTLGNASIRQLHMHVDTANVDRLLGAYAIVAKLPQDPNVDITLAACDTFATRSDIATAIANYLIPGVPWAGFLLGGHVAGQRNVQLFQRPGTRVPTIGRTLVLVVDEGLPTEHMEWVRVIRVESTEAVFSETTGSGVVDYMALVVNCEIASPLSRNLPGTDPNRLFAVAAGKTRVRDSTTADAANYYGARPLASAAVLGALTLKCTSAYGQLVPSSATPVPSLDQRPAAQRTIVLADSPRRVEVAAAAHTSRIKIGQENRTLVYVGQMRPPPAPGTVSMTWVGLGNRYTIEDDGAGTITSSAGVGTVDYITGSWSLTLPSLPDVGSAIVTQWGERIAYTNRSSQGPNIRAPEFVWMIGGADEGDKRVVPGTLAIGYTSAGEVRTVGDDGNGNLTGAATGVIDYASRTVVLRPSYMPDAGAVFDVACDLEALSTEIISGVGAPDAGGFISFALADTPAAGTLQISWVTARAVSNTSGATLDATSAGKSTGATNTVRSTDQAWTPAPPGANWPQSDY